MRLRFQVTIVGWLLRLGLTMTTMGVPGSEADHLIDQAYHYSAGDSMVAIRDLEALVQQSATNHSLRLELQTKLPRLLEPMATPEARRFACKEISIIGNEFALPGISRLLRDPSDVGFGCLALSTYPPGPADRILRVALAGSSRQSAIQIIETLGDRRDRSAVELLKSYTAQKDVLLAKAAIVALGKIGGTRTENVLNTIQPTAPPELGAVLIEAKARIAEKFAASGRRKRAVNIYESLLRPDRPDSVRRGAFLALLALDADYGEQRILNELGSVDTICRPLALSSIRSLADRANSSKFSELLPNLSLEEQVWLIESLTFYKDENARKTFQLCLESPDEAVRRAAAAALVKRGNSRSVPILIAALNKAQDREEIRSLDFALGNLPGGAQTERAILQELEKAQSTAAIQIISSLVWRKSPAVLRTVFAKANNSDVGIASAAYSVLGVMAVDDALSALLMKVSHLTNSLLFSAAVESARSAIIATGNTGLRSEAARGALPQADHIAIRCSIIQMLPLCGDAAALSALRNCLINTDPQVQDASVRALADWPNDAVWDELFTIFQTARNDTHRALALGGLVRLAEDSNLSGGEQVAARYNALLQAARDDREIKLILGALSDLAQPAALELVLPFLDHDGLRREAEAAVRKIAESIKQINPQAAAQALSQVERTRPQH